MKLQRSVSRRIGGREYVKHQIIIPNRIIVQAEWGLGDHIEARITKGGILLHRIRPPQDKEKPDYQHFRSMVTKALATVPQGCTWSELRLRAGLKQMTPSPIWVRRLEDENSLERVQDKPTSRVVWKLPLERRAPTLSTLNSWTDRTLTCN